MAIVWLADIGELYSWRWVVSWLDAHDRAALEQNGIVIREWKFLRCVPRHEDLLLVLLWPRFGPPSQFDQGTFTALSEIRALYRSNRLKISVIAPEWGWPSSNEIETDIWRKRCQPILEELAALRHPESLSFWKQWRRTGDLKTLIENAIAGNKSSAPEVNTDGPATVFFPIRIETRI